jgi:hypothetical protein
MGFGALKQGSHHGQKCGYPSEGEAGCKERCDFDIARLVSTGRVQVGTRDGQRILGEMD